MSDILKISPTGQWTLEKNDDAEAHPLAKADGEGPKRGDPKRVVATRTVLPSGQSVPKDEHSGWVTQSISPDFKGDAGAGTQKYGERVKGMYQTGGLGVKNAELAGGSTMEPMPQWPASSRERENWFARWGGKKVKGSEKALRSQHHHEASLDEESGAHLHDLTQGKDGSKPVNVEFVNIPGIYDQWAKPTAEVPTEEKLDRKTGKYVKRTDVAAAFRQGKPQHVPEEGAAASTPAPASDRDPSASDIEAASAPGLERITTDKTDRFKFRRSTHAVHINGVPVGAVTVHHPSKENEEHQFIWHPEVKTDESGRKVPGDTFAADKLKEAFAESHPDWDGKITPEQENWLKFTLQNRLKHFVTRAGFKEWLDDAKAAAEDREAISSGAAGRAREGMAIDQKMAPEAIKREGMERRAEEGGVKQTIAQQSAPNAAAGPRAEVAPYQTGEGDRPVPSAKPLEEPNVAENLKERAAARTPEQKKAFAERVKALRMMQSGRNLSPEEVKAQQAADEAAAMRSKMAAGTFTQQASGPAKVDETARTGRAKPESGADAAARLAPDTAQARVESESPTGTQLPREGQKDYAGTQDAAQKLGAVSGDKQAIEAKRNEDKAIIGDAFAKLAPEQQAEFRRNPRKMMEWAQSVLAGARK